MLDLKRASAGSGKTFSLAQYYLRYLISIKIEGEDRRRLRTRAEIEDGLGRILAVTFTNKATAEMQVRIVEKLDALARYRQGDKAPDYLKDFMEEFDVEASEISRVSKQALQILLNDYSNFKVSTIDSFFQLVLRTFAYESGYNDNYQVEMESDYVSRIGIDGALDDVDSDRNDSATNAIRQWVLKLMEEEEGTKWNIFQRQEPKMHSDESPYKSLLESFKRIGNEVYQEHRNEIEDYLTDDATDLMEIYRKMESKYRTPVKTYYKEMRRLADEVISLCNASDYKMGVEAASNASWILSRAQNISKYKWGVRPKTPQKPLADDFLRKGKMAVAVAMNPGYWQQLFDKYRELYEAMEKWLAFIDRPQYRFWDALRGSFPFLGLLQGVQCKRKEFLQENNSVELSETSMILSRIIGPSDTPFVYERMGAYLNHFLIDEFQDTSLMQWKNLKPLLSESMSRDHDNLVIGDAKQSIYRFRNAAPELISYIVPKEFFGNINLLGNTSAENKNWRSDFFIVDWNNRFFDFVVKELPDVVNPSRCEVVRDLFGDLYGNVIQDKKFTDGGYVQVVLKKYVKPAKKGDALPDFEGDDEKSYNKNHEILKVILDALARGYSQKDICILTRKVSTSVDLINYLNEYNRTLEDDSEALSFVSEQSLLIGNCESVIRIVTVLDSIARGRKPVVNRDEVTRARYGSGNVKDLECNLLLYQHLHPELSRAECMERFLDEEPDTQVIADMLGEMQTMALPALVEAIIQKFLPTEMREHDAVFLAAFQDCVLEYCDGHPSDLPSFLKFWDRKKSDKSISSPEDANSIRVMTIHKAKGLEFPVVIIPELSKTQDRVGDFVSEKDWTWVSREHLKNGDIEEDVVMQLPPWMPVRINNKLEGTPMQDLLYRNYDLETMDMLNLAYVAMTRAVNELYIFDTRRSNKYMEQHNRSFGALMECFAENNGDILIDSDDEKVVLRYGERPERYEPRDSDKDSTGEADKEGDKEENARGNEAAKKEIEIRLSDYHSVKVPDCIKIREETLPDYADSEDYDVDADHDPRSMGNVCHAIMENVFTLKDLPLEIERARALGIMGNHNDYGHELQLHVRESLKNPKYGREVKRWFGGGAKRIICERSLLKKNEKLRRPDRIMIWPDNSVDIIDYKFGKIDVSNRHARQVKRYVDWLKDTGEFRKVRGWLWYVTEETVEFVCE